MKKIIGLMVVLVLAVTAVFVATSNADVTSEASLTQEALDFHDSGRPPVGKPIIIINT